MVYFLFFIVFFRIAFIHPLLSFCYIVGLAGAGVSLTQHGNSRLLLKSFNSKYIFFLLFILLYSLIVDLCTMNLFNNLNSSFSVRTITIILGSILSAYFIVCFFNVNSKCFLYKIIKWVFILQLFFWLATFFSPSFKSFIYYINGMSGSSNLNDFNALVRGFGYSTEINYTTPILMVVLCIFYIRNIKLSFVTVLTQIINSNLASIGLILSFMLSKVNFLIKLLSITLFFLFILVLGAEFFPRFYDEFVNGDGLRTINILLESHLTITNTYLYEHIFGSFRYLFHGSDVYRSDIGWIILYNYGGIAFTFLVVGYFVNLICLSFKSKRERLLFFILFLILNTKGLVLGVNSFVFILHVFLFSNVLIREKVRS